MAKSKKSWEKRLASKPDPVTVDFVQSLSLDRRLYKYDIVGSIAHAQMLANQKLIKNSEFKKMKTALLEIAEQIEKGKFKFDKELEDIHMAVEAALIKKIGDVGKKLHTGRSRNDQVATDIRLWVRDQIEIIQTKITLLQKAFVKLAARHTEDIMPAYTHLQRAQPCVIASYLLSFVEQLQRDFIRLGNCSKLLNVSPLGSGAVTGSTLPIDPKQTAALLGFPAVSSNSIDAVSDRDFAAEFIFDCTLIAAHLSRLAEDWIIYSTAEFGFIKIADSFCTSSSMMPQKRNPDLLELVRGKTGTVYGSLMAMLTVLKAQPTGYNRDLQEDKVHIFSASDTISASLDVVSAIVSNTKFNTKKITAGLDIGYLDATSLAEYLVGKGTAFRQAHGIVGCIVAACEKQNKKLADIKLNEFKKYSKNFEKDVYKSLSAKNVVRKFNTPGAPGPKQAKKQIAYWKKLLAKQ